MGKRKPPAEPECTVTTLGRVLFALNESLLGTDEDFDDLSPEMQEHFENLAAMFGGVLSAYADQVIALVEPLTIGDAIRFGSN
jgi:hypothetical protein